MFMTTKTCPFCEEAFDTCEWTDGECPSCGKAYSWEEIWDDATGDYLDADSWTNIVWGVRD